MIYKYIILISLLNSFVFSNQEKSIYEQNNIAHSYYEAGLYEDALRAYNNILDVKKSIFGDKHSELISTLYILSDIYFAMNDIETSEEYLKNALNIQYDNFLKEQKKYIPTFNKIKKLYSAINDSNKIIELDSILNILSTIENDSTVFLNDSLNYYPEIVHFYKATLDSMNLVSQYSNNDKAIDYINAGLVYLENKLYTEAIKSFDSAINLDANIIDKDFLLNLNFQDSITTKEFAIRINEVSLYDSTIISGKFLLGLINIKSKGELNETVQLLEEYTKKAPHDIRPFLILGDLYFNQQDYFNSLSYYYRANLINFQQLDSQLNSAISMYYLEEYLDAIEKLKFVTVLDEYNAIARFYLGLSYIKLNKYENAIHFITEALLLNYSNEQVYYYLGLAYKNNGDKMQALEAFKQTIALNPNHGMAHFELGDIYESILKIDLALEEYQYASKHINNDTFNLRYGSLLFKNQFYKKAMTPLRNYIINNPYNDTILTYLGEIFISENRFPEAIDTYNRLIDLNPYYKEYYQKIAESFYNLGNYKASKNYYIDVLSFDDEDPNVLLMVGDIFNKLYEFEKSEKYLSEAMQCGIIDDKLLFELGISYGGQKKYLQAAQSFKEAIKFSEEENPILFFQLGVVYQELSLHDLAILEFEKFLSYNNDDVMVNSMMGACYQNLSQFKEAIHYFEKALNNKQANKMNILYQLGICHLNLDQNNNAAKYFKRVLKINQDHSLSRYQLINLYLSLNKTREAKKECDILFMLDRDLYNASSYCTSL